MLQFEELHPLPLDFRRPAGGLCDLLVFLLQTPRVVQEFADLAPDGALKQVAPRAGWETDERCGAKANQ